MVEKTAADKTPIASPSKAVVTTPLVADTATSVIDAEEPKKKKKKRKKRYSSGTRDAQKLERAFSRAAGRIARAVSVGLETYNEESGRSGRKKKDGAVRDALVNASLGMGDALQEASRAPRELAKGIPSGVMWRQMRSVARVVLPPT
jgi:hypothetical protein